MEDAQGGLANVGWEFVSASRYLHCLTRELQENPITIGKVF
jgi:hypothetical protein